MIKLSIIIPHYNSMILLEKLLRSIPECDEIQVLVVDDNSPVEKAELEAAVAQHSNACLLYNTSGKNSAGRCRNIGLAAATGEWLLFADADDYFLEGFYDKISCYLESQYDIVYFMPTSIELKTGKIANRHEAFASLVRDFCNKKDRLSEIRLRYYQEGPISKLIRRKMVTENGIDFDCGRVANDVMFSIKCAFAAKKIAAVEEEIYCITKGDKSLTADLKKENFYTRLTVFLDKYCFLRERLPKADWKALDLLGEHYIKMAKMYGLSFGEVCKVRWLLAQKGVRVYISRKWTFRYLLNKIRNR